MIVLPLRHLSEVDQAIFGANLSNLAKLARLDFPIPKGIAISPPEIILETILKYWQSSEKEQFQQHFTLIKRDLLKIPIPEELEKELGKEKKDKKKIWLTLLNFWLEEIKARLWQEGFGTGLTFHLTSQAIFFLKGTLPKVTAYFDPDLEEVVIKSEEKINPSALKEIDTLVTSANKKLFLPQVYQLVLIKGKPYFVSLTPFTQTLPVSQTSDIILSSNQQKKLTRRAVKIFLNLSSGFAPTDEIDGVLIEAEAPLDFDKLVFKLAETALGFPQNPIIYKLPDQKDKEIRGTLGLLNQKELLRQAAEIFLFLRHKRNLLNIELAIPFVRSSRELKQIKQELSSYRITRCGSLKFWLEMAVPENLINLEEYLEEGIDGVILNLDELEKLLGGYSGDEGEFYQKQVKALREFISSAIKTLHQNKILILAKGEICLHPDVLDFLIQEGIWGVVANNPQEAESLPEYLNWSERRMVLKKALN